jgi:hypothetical protein
MGEYRFAINNLRGTEIYCIGRDAEQFYLCSASHTGTYVRSRIRPIRYLKFQTSRNNVDDAQCENEAFSANPIRYRQGFAGETSKLTIRA